MLVFLPNSLWRGTIAFEAKKKPHIASTKKDGFVAETSNKSRNIYIHVEPATEREPHARTHAHTGRRTQRTRKRGARDARALRCDYASFMLGLSKDVTFEPWMDQDALIDWVEHIKPIVLRMRPAARL